jgi:ElaB/YqjD/DUF883 family membrane-anchored ribosome-binding protein
LQLVLWKEANMRNAVLAFELYRDVKAAKKAIRRSRRTIERFADDATAFVKQNTFKSLGVAFGFGAAAGWLISRR